MDKNNDNEFVYHYCSVEAFLNIVQRKTLWLSDIQKSNDSKEYTWIQEKINNQIEELLEKNDTKALKVWKMFRNAPSSMSIYVACFSERKDFLSQWRGYAQDGQGLAIGFSKKHLIEFNMPHISTFDKVIYSEKQQQRFIDKKVNETIKKMAYGVAHAAVELIDDYRLIFPLYKNPSFVEEKEWRIIIPSYSDVKSINYFGDFQIHPPKFRVNEKMIISYLELDFSKIKNDIIKEIWIGPKSKVSPQDVTNLLAANNYYDNIPDNDSEPIIIERSTSSYQ